MSQNQEAYQRPSSFEIFMNQFMGKLAAWGLGPSYMVQLIVRGRKSGKLYTTAVNLMTVDGIDYLVAPRGTTSWVRNVRATGEVTLKRGRMIETVRLEELTDDAKPPLLKEYLDRYKSVVQRYFRVLAGSEVEAFAPIAVQYPVFRLMRDRN